MRSEELVLVRSARQLVELVAAEPGQARVEADLTQGCVVIEVHSSADDEGRLIGRNGQTAKSIRTLLDCVAGRLGVRYTLHMVRGRKASV